MAPLHPKSAKVAKKSRPAQKKSSFIVPHRLMSQFDRLQINALSRLVDLSRVDSIRRHVLNNYKSTLQIPNHVISSHEDWHTTIHAIWYYSLMSSELQQAELAKEELLDVGERRRLRHNRNRLMENKPAPIHGCIPSCGMSQRQLKRQHINLVKLCASRSESIIGRKIAHAISVPASETFQSSTAITDLAKYNRCAFITTSTC